MLDLSTWLCLDAAGHADGCALGQDAGDGTADLLLRDFLVANYAGLHRRLARHLNCPDLASECLHETWLRLHGLAVPAIVQCPEAYVYRTACNLAMDRLRGNRYWQYLGDVELERLADDVPGPDHIAAARSDLAAVERAMEHLPRRHRAVLVGLRIEEMTRQEVAARYGLSLRSVDTALRQALDHCAGKTGHSVLGGVGTPRRALRVHIGMAQESVPIR